jgi:hypothetical protein
MIMKLSIYLHESSDIAYEYPSFFDKFNCGKMQAGRGKPQSNS